MKQKEASPRVAIRSGRLLIYRKYPLKSLMKYQPFLQDLVAFHFQLEKVDAL